MAENVPRKSIHCKHNAWNINKTAVVGVSVCRPKSSSSPRLNASVIAVCGRIGERLTILFITIRIWWAIEASMEANKPNEDYKFHGMCYESFCWETVFVKLWNLWSSTELRVVTFYVAKRNPPHMYELRWVELFAGRHLLNCNVNKLLPQNCIN